MEAEQAVHHHIEERKQQHYQRVEVECPTPQGPHPPRWQTQQQAEQKPRQEQHPRMEQRCHPVVQRIAYAQRLEVNPELQKKQPAQQQRKKRPIEYQQTVGLGTHTRHSESDKIFGKGSKNTPPSAQRGTPVTEMRHWDNRNAARP